MSLFNIRGSAPATAAVRRTRSLTPLLAVALLATVFATIRVTADPAAASAATDNVSGASTAATETTRTSRAGSTLTTNDARGTTASFVSGTLAANRWTKVIYGWGYFSVDYSISTQHSGGRYNSYTSPVPWPISQGPLPDRVTHRVIGYGDIWLWSPVETTWYAVPVFP